MSFTHRVPHVIQSGQVTGTLTDFAVPVYFNHAEMKDVAHGGYVALSTGNDIRWYSDTAHTSPYIFQKIYYDGVNGIGLFFVKVPSCAVGSTMHGFYGDAALTTDISSSGVWKSSILAVYPFGDSSGLNLADHTANGLDLTNIASVTAGTGILGLSAVFNGSTQFLECTGSTALSTPARAVHAWINADAFPNTYNTVVSMQSPSAVDYFDMHIKSTGKLACYAKATGDVSADGTGATLSTATDYMLSMNYDSTNGLKVEINNAADLSVAANGVLSTALTVRLDVGNADPASNFFDGKISWVQIFDTPQTTDWRQAEINSKSNPTAFAPRGTQVALSAPALDGAVYERSFLPQPTGPLPVTMRISIEDPSGECNFMIGESGVPKIIIGFRSDRTLVAYDGDLASDVVLVTDYIAGYNYRVEPDWDTVNHPDQFRVKVNNGAWSAWMGTDGSYTDMDTAFIQNTATAPPTFDFWVDAIHSTPGSSGIIDSRWLLGWRIYLNSETVSVASDHIRTPFEMLRGVLLNQGYIERSIPIPAGPPQFGDCQLWLADTDGRLRNLLTTQTARRRLIEAFRITDGTIVGSYEIADDGIELGDRRVGVRGSDISNKWMNKPMPGLINRTNFPYLAEGVDEDFLPVIFGWLFSSAENPQGLVRVPHIGQTTIMSSSPLVSVDRWGIARHQIQSSAPVIYRKLPGDESFSIVDPGEYTLTVDEFFTDVISYFPTYLDFYATQDVGTEIRIDTKGVSVSPAFGGMPQFDTDLRNPIDFMSVVLYEMVAGMGGDQRAERWNTDSLLEVRDYFVSNNLYCDGVIDRPETPANFLTKLLVGHEFHFYINRHNQYEVAINVTTNEFREVMTDAVDFLKDAGPDGNATVKVTPQMAINSVNRIDFKYALCPATGEWAGSESYDRTSDQEELGNAEYQDNTPQVEPEVVEFHYVRDRDVALGTAIRRSAFKALGSHRGTGVVSTPLWFERIELARQIGWTHAGGIADGGWVNQEMIITSYRHDLETLESTVGVIQRVPVEY